MSLERPVLAPDLADAVAQAGVDSTLEGRELQDALRRAIATRRGSCDWTVDHAGWVVLLRSPEEQRFYGRTLEEVLAWSLVADGARARDRCVRRLNPRKPHALSRIPRTGLAPDVDAGLASPHPPRLAYVATVAGNRRLVGPIALAV